MSEKAQKIHKSVCIGYNFQMSQYKDNFEKNVRGQKFTSASLGWLAVSPRILMKLGESVGT